jgi:hypothetical protein
MYDWADLLQDISEGSFRTTEVRGQERGLGRAIHEGALVDLPTMPLLAISPQSMK